MTFLQNNNFPWLEKRLPQRIFSPSYFLTRVKLLPLHKILKDNTWSRVTAVTLIKQFNFPKCCLPDPCIAFLSVSASFSASKLSAGFNVPWYSGCSRNSSNRLDKIRLSLNSQETRETKDPMGRWRVKWLTMNPSLSTKGHTTNTNLIEGKKY